MLGRGVGERYGRVRCIQRTTTSCLQIEEETPIPRSPPPTGIDGKRVEIHHVDQNPYGPYQEMLKRDHQRIRNPKQGLTAEQRRLFNQARRRYWERQWDAGRFSHLPE